MSSLAVERIAEHRRDRRRAEPGAVHSASHVIDVARAVRARHAQLEAAGDALDAGHARASARSSRRSPAPRAAYDAISADWSTTPVVAGVQRRDAAHRRLHLAQPRRVAIIVMPGDAVPRPRAARRRRARASSLSSTATISLPRRSPRHAVRVAPRVQQPVAFDAERVLQRARRIVDAGMDDAAVVRAGLVAPYPPCRSMTATCRVPRAPPRRRAPPPRLRSPPRRDPGDRSRVRSSDPPHHRAERSRSRHRPFPAPARCLIRWSPRVPRVSPNYCFRYRCAARRP